MKENFDVTGMSCSACSARVEKAVSKVPGVDSVNVNLLKNSMVVDFDPSRTNTDRIISAVTEAGYGAQQKSTNNVAAPNQKKNLHAEDDDSEIKNMKLRLIVSVLFSIPLMYVAMAPMVSQPLPSWLSGHQNIAINAFTQFLLTIPVVFINFKFFRIGFKSLFQGAPNMDSLVAIGSAASIFFGLFSFYMILIGLSENNASMVTQYGHNLYFDSAAMILTLITLGKFFEARAKKRTTNAISKLLELVPEEATILKDGKEIKVNVSQILPNDLVVLKTGERIPVDGIVEEGDGAVDESSLTGESLPVEKAAGSSLSGGTLVNQGHFIMKVTKVGEDTALAQIIKLVDDATSSKAPVARLADKVSGIFVPTVIGIAVLASVIWMLLGYSWEFALMIGVSVLVISCPCALGLATPTAIMVGSGKGAQNGILFKSAEAIENGEKATAVVLDKTGTVTAGKPFVTDLIVFNNNDEKGILSKVFAVENKSEHPLAVAICNFCRSHAIELSEAGSFSQVAGSVSGIVGTEKVEIGNLKALGIKFPEIEELFDKLAYDGKTPLLVQIEGKPSAVIAISDPIKEDSKIAIEAMLERGQKVWMVTGDNEKTAKAVASKVGITQVVSGVLPADKEKIVRKLQSEGNKVIMVGDGINDAPALAAADIGIAIGAGTDVAIESADIVVMKSRLTDVVNAELLSHSTMNNIRQNLFWAFFYNVIGIPVAAGVFYPLLGWTLNPMIAAAAMSLSSVSVVSNALRLRGWKPKFNEDSNDAEDQDVDVEIKKINMSFEDKQENVQKSSMEIGVDGMTCGHCTKAVEKAIYQLLGVQSVRADLDHKKVSVNYSGDLSANAVKEAISNAGYLPYDLKTNDLKEFVVKVDGMTCSHCTKAVEKALLAIPNIKSVKADLEKKEVIFTYEGSLPIDAAKDAIKNVGYVPVEEPKEERVKSAEIGVDGMMCSHCTRAVEKAVTVIPGIKTVKADLDGKKVLIEYKGDLPKREIKESIKKAGYSVYEIK